MLANQMMNSGVFFDSTVILPNAGSEPIIEWFEKRMAHADPSAMQFCFVRRVPAGADINQLGWAHQELKLSEWCGYLAAWSSEGALVLTASIPAAHERLYLSMLCTLPLDDDGTPMATWEASEGQLSSA